MVKSIGSVFFVGCILFVSLLSPVFSATSLFRHAEHANNPFGDYLVLSRDEEQQAKSLSSNFIKQK